MSYTDCITGVATSRLVSGPSLLVLPPIWILGVLALLPFIPMLAMAWFNRPKATPAPEPRIVAPIEPDPPPDPYPAWLKQLDDSRKTLAAVEIAAAESELTPTMIIGVGPVGRVVLSQIGQTLRARYGGRLPDGVRLLQIDVQPKDVAGLGLNCPEYLESEEWVLLEPDLEEVSRTIQRNPQDWPHLAWYEAAAMEEYGRTRGRMALFYDLMNGADRSILWRSLTRTTTKLDHPKLRLIGSTFDDTGVRVAAAGRGDPGRLVRRGRGGEGGAGAVRVAAHEGPVGWAADGARRLADRVGDRSGVRLEVPARSSRRRAAWDADRP